MSRPLRVLVVHNRYRGDVPSGENEVVDAELAALAERGVEVRGYLRSSDEIPGMPLHERATLPLRPLFSRRDVRAVGRIVESWRPDVLHLHNPYPLISPAVVGLAGREGVATVQTVHNFRRVCVSGLHFRAGRECFECVGHNVPVPAVRHGCYRDSRAQSVVMAAAASRARRVFAGLDRYVALTDHVAAHLVADGADPARVVVKPNTVPDPGPARGPGRGFVFVGRLSAEKGLDLLLRAWARHSDGALGPLTVVGDGPQRADVDALAASRDDVVVTGQVPPARVRELMAQAATVVVPSVWAEAFPRVVVEAMASRRAVVVTDKGALADIVGPGGWAASPDVDGLAAALARAGAADTHAVGGAARARYEALFSPDVVHGRLIDIYRDAVRSRSGQSASPQAASPQAEAPRAGSPRVPAAGA